MADKPFEKRIRKYLRKTGWTLSENYIAGFRAEREVFSLHVLLGPEIFDLRFPVVDNFFTKQIFDIRASCAGWTPNVMVAVRDRDTLPLYERLRFDNVAALHVEALHELDGLTIAALSKLAEPPGWAARLIRMNAVLSQFLAGHAASLGHEPAARYWSAAAPASAG